MCQHYHRRRILMNIIQNSLKSTSSSKLILTKLNRNFYTIIIIKCNALPRVLSECKKVGGGDEKIENKLEMSKLILTQNSSVDASEWKKLFLRLTTSPTAKIIKTAFLCNNQLQAHSTLNLHMIELFSLHCTNNQPTPMLRNSLTHKVSH
jgi:hypothetical protein